MAKADIYGPALVAWLDELRGAQSVRSFAADHGLDDQRIHSWRGGATPGIDQLRAVAEGLGVSFGEVLLRAALIQQDELVLLEQEEPAAPGIDDAIERDPDLTDGEREILRAARRVARDAVRGNVKSSRTRVEVRRSSRSRR